MPYVVNASCVWCRSKSCVAVCPVDCFYEDELQLYIHPDECIDCGACEPECPSGAIRYEETLESEDARLNAARASLTSGEVRPARDDGAVQERFDEQEHGARRDAFLADLARAARAAGREDVVVAVEVWLPARRRLDGQPRPSGPGPGVERDLLGLLRESFPDRWLERVQDVRRLLAGAAPLPLPEDEDDGGREDLERLAGIFDDDPDEA